MVRGFRRLLSIGATPGNHHHERSEPLATVFTKKEVARTPALRLQGLSLLNMFFEETYKSRSPSRDICQFREDFGVNTIIHTIREESFDSRPRPPRNRSRAYQDIEYRLCLAPLKPLVPPLSTSDTHSWHQSRPQTPSDADTLPCPPTSLSGASQSSPSPASSRRSPTIPRARL